MVKSVLPTILTLLLPIVAAAADKPNIVFILADDLGWSDTTLYGTTTLYRTPNIERLAKRGMTFTRAYSASPLCSPTRASILTGLSPARHGITAPTCHQPQVVLRARNGTAAAPQQKAVAVASVTRLKTDYATLPKALKAAGYATAHFGKWHLGHEPYSPLEHGFDIDLPHHAGPGPAGSYVAPWKFKDFDHDPDVPDQHIEDRMAQEAVRWMEKHKDEPFFLNYWMFSVHAPFDAKPALIKKYRDRVDSKTPQRSPTYAAMIESMDDAVGTLLDALDRLKLADKTIVVFTSDNGGNMYNQVDGTTPTSNAPLRGGKATMYEGGVRVPCVVCVPDLVLPNTRSDAIIQSCDFYPTLLELVAIDPPRDQKFDGVTFVEVLQGSSRKCDPIFTYFPHNPRVPDWLPPSVSVHHGDLKLIRIFYGGEEGAHQWKLFNLHDDPGEKHNLASKEPRKLKRLDQLIDRFLADTNAVQPIRNPKFDSKQFRPELIGKPLRNNPPASGTTAGWSPSRFSKLTIRESTIELTSSGNDPFMTFRMPAPLPAGDYALEMTVSSTSKGRGQFFWQERGAKPKFHRDRSVSFDMNHDGQPNKYRIAFTTTRLATDVRLDPGQGPGKIRISAINLRDASNKVVHAWTFKAKK